jgi:hypothetical protein
MNLCSRDLRQARAPRHRSERPTTGSAETEEMVESSRVTMVETIRSDGQGSFLVASPDLAPRLGHPRDILRPPSLAA